MGLLHFDSRMALDSPKMPQDRPKTVQDKPKTAQDRPNTAQDRTKAAKDRPKIAPSASCVVFYNHSERLFENSNTPSRSCVAFHKYFGRRVAHSPRETHPQTASRAARNIGRVWRGTPLGRVAASHFPPKVFVLHRASALVRNPASGTPTKEYLLRDTPTESSC